MRQQNTQQRQDGLSEAQGWIAGIAAAILTFLLTPLVHKYTAGFLLLFTQEHYGSGLVGLVYFAWWGIAAAAIYFTSNALLQSWLKVVLAKFFIRSFR